MRKISYNNCKLAKVTQLASTIEKLSTEAVSRVIENKICPIGVFVSTMEHLKISVKM